MKARSSLSRIGGLLDMSAVSGDPAARHEDGPSL
jgi:hypothetical protein